jgi:hypothetical protein
MPISSALGISALLPGSLGFRNKIINGDMVINQRNTAITNSGYSVDRWALQKFGGATISVAQSSDAPSVFTNSLKMTCTSGAANTSAWLYQRVEGYNAASLGFGTASAKQVTVSFWVKSSLSGTYSVTLQNNNATRVYAASYAISAADTWEYKTVSISGDTQGTWLKTTSSGLSVLFPFVNTGSPSSAFVAPTLNAWFTGAGGMAYNAGTSATPDVTATTGNIFAITGVQLEQNYQPTPFEQRPIGVELALCQRYYALLASGVNSHIGTGAYGTNTQIEIQTSVPVSMRTTPTIAVVTGTNYYVCYGLNFAADYVNSMAVDVHSADNRWILLYNNSEVSATAGNPAWLRGNDAAARIAFSAEL